jgi:3-deoxy-manno-octulosonate cytidylyltransferase (CMP-KDO synthetase)
MTSIVVIPARLASTRLPNKALIDIHGKPMIHHVIEQALQANIGPVLVASGDEAITAAAKASGAHAVATDPNLPSGTDRVAAALQLFDPDSQYDYVINLQGDLPTIPPEYIRLVNETLQQYPYDIATLASQLPIEQSSTPSIVKAVLSIADRQKAVDGVYFCRNPIASSDGHYYHHIGIYGYKRSCLDSFVAQPPVAIEQSESLEQLRALVMGMRIGVQIVPQAPLGVDTPEDLEKIRENFAQH